LNEHNEYRTEDLAFAAFLRVRGYNLSRVEKLNPTERNSKRAFYFDVPRDVLQELKLEFVNSDLLRFYNEQKKKKKL